MGWVFIVFQDQFSTMLCIQLCISSLHLGFHCWPNLGTTKPDFEGLSDLALMGGSISSPLIISNQWGEIQAHPTGTEYRPELRTFEGFLVCIPCRSGNDLDVSDADFLASHTSRLSEFPSSTYSYSYSPTTFIEQAALGGSSGGGGSTGVPSSRPINSGGADTAGSPGFAPNKPPTARDERVLAPTVLVTNVVVGPDGVGNVTLPAPQKLSTYVARVYGATSGQRFGSDESSFIVARQLSLTPSVARLVRVGDHFEAGIIVTLRGVPGEVLPVCRKTCLPSNSYVIAWNVSWDELGCQDLVGCNGRDVKVVLTPEWGIVPVGVNTSKAGSAVVLLWSCEKLVVQDWQSLLLEKPLRQTPTCRVE